MNITASTSTSATALVATTDTAVAAAAATTPVPDATDAAGEAGGESHGHGAHGGHGHLRQALNQALQSLGLTSTPRQGDRDGDDQHGVAGNVKHDMAQFMHALFQAVKGELPSAPGSTGTSSASPRGSFAAGLSALITQASSGTAPQALQNAFDKLAADFQSAAAPAAAPEPAATPDPSAPSTDPIAAPTSLSTTVGDVNLATAGTTTTDAASASSAASATPVATTTAAPAATSSALTLQALLSRLQQAMGSYGTRSAWTIPSTGNAVNLTA